MRISSLKPVLPTPLLCGLVLAISCSIVGGSDNEADPPASFEAPPPTVVAPAPAAATGTPAPADSSPRFVEVSVTYSHPFIWPAAGPITSYMGPEHPSGIDIGLDTGSSKRVRAAAGGTVVFSGGDDSDDYGIHVEIDHGNGYTTVYGHLERSVVDAGDQVEIGQTLGQGGSTGISNGDHLHFEVLRLGQTLDPLDVLPETRIETESVRHDCMGPPLTLDAGSEALFDFRLVLQRDESLVSATISSDQSSPGSVELTSPTRLLFSTPIDYRGPAELVGYDLEVNVDGQDASRFMSCALLVEKLEIGPTFYARATATPDPDALAAAEIEGTPTATPTRVPGVPEFPSYQQPGPIGGSGPQPTATATPTTQMGNQPEVPTYQQP